MKLRRIAQILRRKVRRLGSALVRAWLRVEFRGPSVHTAEAVDSTKAKQSRRVMLGIGPTNTAGLGQAWARAVREVLPDASAESFGLVIDGPLKFPHDRPVTNAEWNSPWWQLGQARRVLRNYTHVLAESGQVVLGALNGRSFDDDLAMLESVGIHVALVFHGSEIRDPDRHSDLEPFSPFRDVSAESDPKWHARVQRLREISAEGRALAHRCARLPIFVTTLGLQDDVSAALWLPAVVDRRDLQNRQEILRGRRPAVLHLPTNSKLKGSEHADRTCRALEQRGLIDYLRPSVVSPTEVPGLLHAADILIDGLVLGDAPSVTACQALASGRLVLGHVATRVRQRFPVDLPIVEATPETLEEVLCNIEQDRAQWRAWASIGPDYVDKYHSGPYSIRVLEPFLGLSG